MLDLLPAEVVERIFGYTSTQDAKNVSCCSRAYNAVVKPLLWKTVVIPFFQCDLTGITLSNLKYTEYLVLGQYCGNDEDGDPVVCCQEVVRGGFRFGFHYARILNYCNPTKIKGMTFSDIDEGGVHYALDIFRNITNIALHYINMENWDRLWQSLVVLERLKLISCDIDDTAVKTLVKMPTLNALSLHCCWQITGAAVECIGNEATNLKEFILENNNSDSGADSDSDSDDEGSNKFVCDFGVLSQLTELRCLLIQGCVIYDTSLLLLCQTLTKLEVLNLHNSKFTDEGLSQIHLLTSLTKLEITECSGLSKKCMVHLSTHQSLREIVFSGNIRSAEYDNLNYIPTLDTIYIIGRNNHRNERKVYGILKVLCASAKWKLRVDQHGDYDHYILTYCDC